MMISSKFYNNRVSNLLGVDEFAWMLFEGHKMFVTFQRQTGVDSEEVCLSSGVID